MTSLISVYDVTLKHGGSLNSSNRLDFHVSIAVVGADNVCRYCLDLKHAVVDEVNNTGTGLVMQADGGDG